VRACVPGRRGGFKKSGIGREMGPLALLPFLEVKAITGWPSDKAVGWYPETHFTASAGAGTASS